MGMFAVTAIVYYCLLFAEGKDNFRFPFPLAAN
jgi:hypothetical protein